MSDYYDYDEPVTYSETQKHWHKFYSDKQWIDTKGWCDMNGNPLPHEHDELPKKKKTEVIITGSSNAYGLESFDFRSIVKKIAKILIILYLIYMLSYMIYPTRFHTPFLTSIAKVITLVLFSYYCISVFINIIKKIFKF